MVNNPLLSVLVLDYKKPKDTKICLESIRKNVKVPYKLVYLDNGSNEDYCYEYYKNGLCDVFLSKKNGMGGGYGQTDLIRFCDTKYFIFVQNDQELIEEINDNTFDWFIGLFNNGCHCVNLNGGQNGNNWTDRAHLMETEFFNSLGPFPNGGPGYDNIPWNEAYLGNKFKENNFKIAFIKPLFFRDNGKWSVREAGDGIYMHRCDSKGLNVIKWPTYATEVYPPLDLEEWDIMLDRKWVNGTVPKKWKEHVFQCWPD